MTNSGKDKTEGVLNPIKILKSDGKWISLRYPEIAGLNNLERTMFDKRGNFWVISSWIADYGVFCLDTKGTLEDSSDDKHKFIKNFTIKTVQYSAIMAFIVLQKIKMELFG